MERTRIILLFLTCILLGCSDTSLHDRDIVRASDYMRVHLLREIHDDSLRIAECYSEGVGRYVAEYELSQTLLSSNVKSSRFFESCQQIDSLYGSYLKRKAIRLRTNPLSCDSLLAVQDSSLRQVMLLIKLEEMLSLLASNVCITEADM